MKKFIAGILLILTMFICTTAHAEWVNGYYRKNGTYVNRYYRSDPDYTVRNNYSYYGNRNPFTGKIGRNRYYCNPTSEYYNPYYNSRSSGLRWRSGSRWFSK